MSSGVETELKFDLLKGELDRLRSSTLPDDFDIGPADLQKLVSTYYDTSEHRLRAAGLSLRVRASNGSFEQTLKSSGNGGAALNARTEINAELAGDQPNLAAFADAEAVDAVREVLDGHDLVPVFTVAVTRRARTIRTRHGDEIEYALDDGEIVAGDVRRPLSEAEFELKSGDLRALFPVARAALAGVPVRFSGDSKAGRGYRLLGGEELPGPVKAGDVAVDAAANVEEAMQQVLRSCVSQIIANVAAVEAGDDPEGPHQLRIGLRRLRSALKVFKPVVDPAAAGRIDAAAKRLGRVVGRLRDLDVLVDEIVGSCAGRFDVSDLDAVLRARRDEERREVLKVLAGDEAGGFLIDLVGFTEGRGWLSAADLDQSAALSAPAAKFARKAIHKRWKKTAERGRNVDDLTADERHALRKSFKTLRYSLDMLGSLIGRRDLKDLMKRVKAAQDVLGYLNDVRNARTLLRFVDEAGGKRSRRQSAAIDRAVGFCLGWHEGEAARVWEEAKADTSLDPKAY